MGVFGAVCRCSGDAGFIGPLLGVSGGVVGFNVAMFLRPVRDIVRPARPDVGASAKKFARRAHNGPKLAFDGALGEFFRGSAVVGFRRASLLCRVPGTGALLLAALTLQCAAKPFWWHGGQPAQAATYRVNVRIKGVHVRRMRSQKQNWSQPTKIPTFPHREAKKWPFQQHVVSYNPKPRPRVPVARAAPGTRPGSCRVGEAQSWRVSSPAMDRSIHRLKSAPRLPCESRKTVLA